MLSEIRRHIKGHSQDLVAVTIVVAITVTSFNLGKLAVYRKESEDVVIKDPDGITTGSDADQSALKGGELITPSPTQSTSIRSAQDVPVVASKKSTSGAFHYPWCPGAERIKEENKITFANAAAAIAAGYHIAGNCQP